MLLLLAVVLVLNVGISVVRRWRQGVDGAINSPVHGVTL